MRGEREMRVYFNPNEIHLVKKGKNKNTKCEKSIFCSGAAQLVRTKAVLTKDCVSDTRASARGSVYHA